MAAKNDQPIIIRKKRKKVANADGHGGSAWKVAYADFTTAMMAFFLLLWLVNMMSEEQLEGIADYFSPASVSRGESGSGGVLGGRTVSSPGSLSSPSSPFSLHESLPGRPVAVVDSEVLDSGAADVDRQAEGGRESFAGDGVADPRPREVTDADLQEYMARQEQRQFEEAERRLLEAIQGIPELAELADNLIIDQTPEGLRIQIIDQERYSMFPSGDADMYDRTRQLMTLVGQAITGLPNEVSIRGHTDSVPFADGASYDNWELSADRANASRRALVQAGLSDARISNVVGKADTDHLIPDEPDSPRNRRISIILLRQSPMTDASGLPDAEPS